MSAARRITTCASSDAYSATGSWSRTPCSRTAWPRLASRAHLSATKFAIAPPVMIIPPDPSGSPKRRASQRVRCSSISAAPGPSR